MRTACTLSHTRSRTLSPLFAGLLLCGAAGVSAEGGHDEIVLKNGSRVIGEITSARDGKLKVDTEFAGTLTIPLEHVESVHGETPVDLLLSDETVVDDRPLTIEDGQLVTAAAPERPLDELKVLNPEPWELGQGYKWYGDLSFALAFERGNSDTDELDYKFGSTWRSKEDRYRLTGYGQRDEANGVRSADDWHVNGKYDYFLEGPNYWGWQLLAEHDDFTDLNLRWLTGPYLGRQFYDEPELTLSGEIGLAYVSEDFNIAEDQHYPATTWSFDASSDILGEKTRLYLTQFGLWNMEDTSDMVVDTTAGIAVPLIWSFEAAAEALWEYDSGSSKQVKETDQTYRLRIGYTW